MLVHQTTREERAHHVAQMRASFALEGIHPQADDVDIEQRYIDAKISLDDMLQHARDFARIAATPDDLGEG
ncbi:MAG: antitoxin VbhA family protein [Telluria sp.]